MPVKIDKRDGKYCVIESDGSVVNCHDDNESAVAQMLAINSESKSGDIPDEFSRLYANVKEEVKDKGLIGNVIEIVKSFGKKDQQQILVYKSADGPLRWIGIYSNSFKDRDEDIISTSSHKLYSQLIMSGEVPTPDLLLWHEPYLALGKVDWVVFDEVSDNKGFAIAGGYIHPEAEEVVDFLIESPIVWGMSHGVPKSLLSRDEDGVIDFYFSTELTMVPIGYSRNQLTGFMSYEDIKMDEREQKSREKLAAIGVPEDMIDGIIDVTRELGSIANDADLESRSSDLGDADTDDAAEDVDKADDTEGDAEDAANDVAEKDGDAIKADDSANEEDERVDVALKAIMTVHERTERLEKAITGLEQKIETIAKAEEERIARKAAETPTVSLGSLADMVKSSVVGAEEAKVDGRSSLAKSAPKEEADPGQGSTPFPIINQWVGKGS